MTDRQTRMDRAVFAARMRAAYPRPREVDAHQALVEVGHRHEVHPADVVALVHSTHEAAQAYAAGNRDLYGLPVTWHALVDGGVLAVTDLRHSLMREGKAITDPRWPDDWRRGM
jgi:hypothetical protein